jgi:hypothetical protein
MFFVVYLRLLLWEDNIKMDLKGFGWEDVDVIDLVPDRDNWRFLNAIMNNPVQQ